MYYRKKRIVFVITAIQIKSILTILLLFLNLTVSCQNETSIYPDFRNQKKSQVLENKQWKVLVLAKGDLNSDKKEDLVLILESRDSIIVKRCRQCKVLKNKPRIILVMLNINNEQKVIVQNNVFIARGDEGGMLPYLEPEISIKNNQLTIYYQYTRGNISYIFEYLKDDMIIVSAKSAGVSRSLFESDDFDFQTMKIISESGRISDDATKTTIITIKKNTERKKLSEFKEMYEWEVADNKYL